MDTMTTLLASLIEIPAGMLPVLNNLIVSFFQSGATSAESLPFFLNPVEDIRRLLEQKA